MENKHIIAAGTIGLMILLIVLFIFQSNGSQNSNPSDLLNLTSGNNQSSAPQIKEFRAQELKVGTGSAVVKTGDNITVHYLGAFANGEVFESSYQRNEPLSFTVGGGQVIQGMDQGVAGMKLGGKRRLLIPSNLAYGAAGKGQIPPNSTLVFEIELLDIKSPELTPSISPTISPEASLSTSPTPDPMSVTTSISPTPSPNP